MINTIKKNYKKYLEIPVAARAALWFVVCTVLQRCISFITVPVFTRIMPTDEYGLYSTYLSVYSIAIVICTLSMEKCVFINGIAKAPDEHKRNEIPIPLLSLSDIVTLGCFILYLIFRHFINKIVGLPTTLMCLVFAQVLFEPAAVFWSTKQRYEYKYIKLVIFTIGMVLANAGLGITFVLISSKNQAIARVLSIVIVQIVFGGACYVYFIRRAHAIFKCHNWKNALQIQIPLLPHSLSLTVLTSSDRIMINTLIGAAQAAIYSVAYSAGYVVTTFKNAISSAMTPWIYDKITKKEYDSIKQLTKPIMLFVAVMTFAFICFAPEIVYILAPSDYYEAIYVIPPVAASSYFTFLYNMFSNISFYYEETKKIMIASISGACLNVILNAICIPLFGYIAAGYTTLVCYIVFTVAHYCIMKQISREKMDGANCFDMRYIVLLSIGVVVVTILFSVVYRNVYVRYAIMICLIAFSYFKRSIFIDSIRTVKKRSKKIGDGNDQDK